MSQLTLPVQYFRMGLNHARDAAERAALGLNPGPWLLDSKAIDATMKDFAAQGKPQPVDWDHLSIQTDRPAPFPDRLLNCGRVLELQPVTDSPRPEMNGLWGITRYTEEASAFIRDEKINWTSPVFGANIKDMNRVYAFRGAALTNNPALKLEEIRASMAARGEFSENNLLDFTKLNARLSEADMSELLSGIAKRSDVNPEEGERKYGKEAKFADEKNKKYPIDTPEHIRAAWNYINHPDNAGKYSPEDEATIKRNIIAAWKDKIDKAGPPGAHKDGKHNAATSKSFSFSLTGDSTMQFPTLAKLVGLPATATAEEIEAKATSIEASFSTMKSEFASLVGLSASAPLTEIAAKAKEKIILASAAKEGQGLNAAAAAELNKLTQEIASLKIDALKRDAEALVMSHMTGAEVRITAAEKPSMLRLATENRALFEELMKQRQPQVVKGGALISANSGVVSESDAKARGLKIAQAASRLNGLKLVSAAS